MTGHTNPVAAASFHFAPAAQLRCGASRIAMQPLWETIRDYRQPPPQRSSLYIFIYCCTHLICIFIQLLQYYGYLRNVCAYAFIYIMASQLICLFVSEGRLSQWHISCL